MTAAGEIFLSAFLQVVLDKLASSEMINFFCRESIRTQVMNWETTLREIRAVLDDAKEKQIKNKLVTSWLEELQDLAYDLDDLLDEFSTEALRYELIEKSQSSTNKVRALVPTFMRFNPGGAFFNFKMRSKINEITTRLQDMSKKISKLGLRMVDISRTPIQDRERPRTTSKTYERRIYGRDKSKREIINLLRMEESDLGIIPIIGIGGIGKTTVAQVVYNDEQVKKHFDLKAWICVFDNFDLMRITKEIIGTLKIEKCPTLLLEVLNLVLQSLTTISTEAVPCPSLPNFSSLKSLDIRDVSIPDTLCDPSVADEVEFANVASNHMNSLTSLNFRNIQNPRFLPKWFFEGLRGVESLEINDCNELMTLWQNVVKLEHCHPALRSLQIEGCPQLASLFEEEEEERQQQQQLEGLSFMMRLESLKLKHCEKLEKLPQWLHTLPFLGELEIDSCLSLVSFPDKGLPSTLRKLEISECGALESLPEWMTHTNYNLEVLKVNDCPALKYIISARGGLPPTLKQIEIWGCEMLESLVAEEGIKINCPSLESFEIRRCKKLKFLPNALRNDDNNLKNLRRFVIEGLDYLESIPEGWFSLPTNLREIVILYNKKLDAQPHSLQNNNFPTLEVMRVGSLRPSILNKISFERFSSLTDLGIEDLICEDEEDAELSVFPMEGMSLPTSLRKLFLYNYRYLETLCSVEFQKLSSLKVLHIWKCPGLASVPTEGLPPSLQKLEISYCVEFTSIPEQGLPQSLLELSIYSCPKFGSFPEQGLPQSLLKLAIHFCPKFGSFPEQGLPQSLLQLSVVGCPILARRCEKDKGKYWPLIRHIPDVWTDGGSIFDT
ncbi:hypothetical protein Acr_14g0000560 [Actinidia rufa]|uniref:NB-ARC domain-containing disease resistance protein n=1 Tax=Actinidia rufa TaxID=165716 RepID=A0A7J0FQJ4_9ERIC|nr:hypothetical protein Acr_14g0000560 [Actinidia rufa]